MKALGKLYLANLTEFLSNRRALFLTIAFPVLFIVIFGAVFTNQDKVDADVGLVVEDANDPLSQEIVRALQDAPHADTDGDGKVDKKDREKNPFSDLTFRQGTREALVGELRKGRLDAVITIPAGLARQAAEMKERALRDAAGQIEQARRGQTPPPGEPGARGEDDETNGASRAQLEALAEAHPEALSDPRLLPTRRVKLGGKATPYAGQLPPDTKLAPAPTLSLKSTPAPGPAHPPLMPVAPAASSASAVDPFSSAPVHRVEVVEDDPKPLTPASITLTIDPARQLLRPVLQGLVAHILDGINTHLTGQPPLADLRTESVQARELRTIDYLLPGILALSIMQLGLFATAQPLVALRVQGVLKRLSATPLPRTTLLTAYIAFRLTIALFQTMLTVLIGRYAFKVAMVGSWWQFSGWVLLGTLVFLSVGFFMAAVSKNEESCIAIGNIINLPMILLSGVFFPVSHVSRWLDYVVRLVPLNYLADALRTTMVDAPPLHSAGTNALVLGGWIVVMTALAIRFFSWESR